MASYNNLWSKRQKLENQTVDVLIDVLPEDIISYILSRLPTKEAIKTSVLSKRWRFRWTTISSLDFSDDREVHHTFYDEDGNFVDKAKRNAVYCKNFGKYVNSVLLRPGPNNSLDKFTISLEKYPDVTQIKEWISSAIERDIKDLSLSLEICNNDPIDVPPNLFHCKYLEALRLFMGLHLMIPQRGFVCFPNLKFLSLEYVKISGIPDEENSPCFPKLKTLCLKGVEYAGKDDCVMKLVRNCPLLEDVSIRRSVKNNISYIDMCIPQLTTADLYCVPDQNVRLNVQVEAPIKYLKLSDWIPTYKIKVKNLDSLIGAELRFGMIHSNHFQGEQPGDLINLFKIVEKVKSLSLLCHVIDAVRLGNIKLPLFSNLTRLEVTLDCKDFCVLECLLNSTVNLQILAIRKVFSPKCLSQKKCIEEDGRWMESLYVPKCMLSSLKRVEIINAVDCPGELEMIKNMLASAKVLEMLTTQSSWLNERIAVDSLCRKISTFPRSSASCLFDFPSFSP